MIAKDFIDKMLANGFSMSGDLEIKEIKVVQEWKDGDPWQLYVNGERWMHFSHEYFAQAFAYCAEHKIIPKWIEFK
jgi:hypothetical protein